MSVNLLQVHVATIVEIVRSKEINFFFLDLAILIDKGEFLKSQNV